MISQTTSDIWKKYEKGIDWMHKNSLYTDTETFYNMFEGRQWEGIDSGDEKLSQHNFIQPVCKHKIAMIAMQNMTINYSPLNTGEDQVIYRQACDILNEFAASKWELKKMDAKAWEIVKQGCIGGDSYLFFYNSELDSQLIDRTNIYLSDEQCNDLQKQKYILIYERRFIDDVKADAKKYGLKKEELDLITSDEDTDTLPSNVQGNEVKSGDKCSCLLYLTKKDGKIYVARSTKQVIYQPETLIEGLTLYPIVNFLWSSKRYSSRGIGEVEPLVNNQINTNKLLARREINIKMTGFAKPVYNTEMIANPNDIDKIGTKIGIKGNVNKVQDAFMYMSPAAVSSDAKVMQDELINVSRDLANAGDSATGNINPEKASGAAIIAVKDQQAISSTQTTAAYKQFIEDISNVWLDMWIAYNPNGLTVDLEQDDELTQETIPAEVLQKLQVNVRIDISPTNPFSKFAREQSLENALAAGHIEFAEYVEALDDDANAPKGKFEDIIEKRAEEQQIIETLNQMKQIIDQQNQMLQEAGILPPQEIGGDPNEVPVMQ